MLTVLCQTKWLFSVLGAIKVTSTDSKKTCTGNLTF